MSRWKLLGVVAAVILVLIVWRGDFSSGDSPSPAKSNSTEKTAVTAEDDQDEKRDGSGSSSSAAQDTDALYRQRIVGTWEDDYQGHRTLTVRADGTATMVVEPTGLAAKVYAKRMVFEETWAIENGRIQMKLLSGTPAGRVKLIVQMMGDETEQEILELSTGKMRLLDANGKTEYEWRRVEDADESSAMESAE